MTTRTRSVLGAMLALIALHLGNAAIARANTITWNAPQQISGDTDVDTKGTLSRAYLFSEPGSTSTINGVKFINFSDQGTDSDTFQSYAVTAFSSTNPPYSNTSAAYKQILGNGYYNYNNTVPPATITLNNLTPGDTYEVQVWVNDSRALTRTETVNGSSPLLYDVPNTNGGLGQYVIGTFMADASGSQTLTFMPDSNSVSQVNGLQLRVLSPPLPSATVLTGAVEFSTDNVGNGTTEAYSTIGGGYYLYVKQGNTFLNASNGTISIPLALGTNTFELRGDGTGAADLAMYGLNLFFGGNTSTPSISVFGPEGVPGNPAPPFAPDSAPHTYGGTGQGAGTTTFTAGGYQITLSDYYWQSPTVQNINEVGEYNIGPSGSNDFTGHFTLTVTPYTPSVITWGAPQQIKGDTDVDTKGMLDRAYLFSQPGSTSAINGVAFKNFSDQGTDTENFQSYAVTAFGSTNPPYSNTSAAYKQILGNGYYNYGKATGTITLNHLTPGAMYEVQVWVNDSRALTRTETVNGSSPLLYDVPNTNGGLGQYVIGTFMADASGSQTLTFIPDSKSVAQVNGLQLRVLSPVLAGAIEFSTDNIGNETGQIWTTLGGDSYFLYVKQGSNFLNASNGTLSVPLSLGENTFELRGDGTNAVDLSRYALNLFFGTNTSTPSISVFGPEGTTSNPTPPFAVNSAPNTLGGNGLTPGAGTLTFLSGNYQITLSDYYWQSPTVLNLNEVGEFSIGPSGPDDFTGHIVLTVEPLGPMIASVTPGTIPAGSPSATLTITGFSFFPGEVVQFNGANVTTTFISSTELQATIPGSALLKPGTATVNVLTSAGLPSSAVTVTIAAPSLQPSFTISRDPVSLVVTLVLTLTNTGGGYATGVVLNTATIGAANSPTSPSLPLALGTIAPGTSVTTTLTYSPLIAAGHSTLTLAGQSQSGSISGTFRITVP